MIMMKVEAKYPECFENSFCISTIISQNIFSETETSETTFISRVQIFWSLFQFSKTTSRVQIFWSLFKSSKTTSRFQIFWSLFKSSKTTFISDFHFFKTTFISLFISSYLSRSFNNKWDSSLFLLRRIQTGHSHQNVHHSTDGKSPSQRIMLGNQEVF